MKEQANYSPLVSELISIMPSQSIGETYRKTDLIARPDVIESIARSYRRIRIEIDLSSSEVQKSKLKDEPIFKLTRMIANVYSDVAAEPIRELLVEEYGFSEIEIQKFKEMNDEGNVALTKIFFDYIGFLEGSFSKSMIGRQFEKPFAQFKGKTRLEMIKLGQGQKVLEHLQAGLISGGT